MLREETGVEWGDGVCRIGTRNVWMSPRQIAHIAATDALGHADIATS